MPLMWQYLLLNVHLSTSWNHNVLKTVVWLNALSMDALLESEIFHLILRKQNIKKYEGFDCMLRIGL